MGVTHLKKYPSPLFLFQINCINLNMQWFLLGNHPVTLQLIYDKNDWTDAFSVILQPSSYFVTRTTSHNWMKWIWQLGLPEQHLVTTNSQVAEPLLDWLLQLDGLSQQRVTHQCILSIEKALKLSDNTTLLCCNCDSTIQSRNLQNKSGFSVSAPLEVARNSTKTATANRG